MSDADMLEVALDEFARQGFNVLEHRAALARMVEELKNVKSESLHYASESDRLKDQLAERHYEGTCSKHDDQCHARAIDAEAQLADTEALLQQRMEHLAEADANGLRLAEENEQQANALYETEPYMQKLEAEVERLRAAIQRAEKETHICGPRSMYSEDECPGHRLRQALEGNTSDLRS